MSFVAKKEKHKKSLGIDAFFQAVKRRTCLTVSDIYEIILATAGRLY